MEFLSSDDGVIKHPAYREDTSVLGHAHITRRRRKHQFFDNTTLISPSYTQNLLPSGAAPFTCTPEKVCFANYDVMKEYSVTVTFLNKTTVPRTFRVMPILPKFANALRFQYDVPPRISPGLSWEVTIYFRPRENVDFATALYLKTEEGFFALPISTSRKAFLFSVFPKAIDFGTVVVGEEQTRHITLKNKGALSGTAIVGGAFKSLLEQKHVNPVNGKEFCFFRISPQQYKVEVPPFSTFDVALHFTPLSAVKLDTDVILTDKSNTNVSFTIPVRGASTELPVYLTNGKIDFGACFFNEHYWDEVTIVNRTSITAIADFHIPASLSNVISVSPSRACVQPGEQYTVQVNLVTSKKLPRSFSSIVECVVRGQTLPLLLSICADLSERSPQMAVTAFDVGKLILNTSRVVEVPVTNEASVVQLVGFDSLPVWINASPEVMEVVPQETVVFRLTVEPPQKGRFSQRLRVINEFGDSQVVTISGQGVSASYGMSSRTLLLPPCNLGCSVSATTVLFNASDKAGEFHFEVPNSFFRISPDTGILQPGENIPIAVFLNVPPELETDELSLQPVVSQHPSKSKKDTMTSTVSESVVIQKKPMYDDWESGSENGVWSKHRQFQLKCDINDDSNHSFFFTVRCCVLKPVVFIDDAEVLSKASAAGTQNDGALGGRQAPRKTVALADEAEQLENEPKQTYEAHVDYGKVPIHCVCLRHCIISNRDTDHCFIRAPPMSPLSAFSVLSYAFDGVASQCCTNVCIAFQPRKYGKFVEVLPFELVSLSGVKANVHVRVQGVCSPTQLTISAADSVSTPEKDQPESLSRLFFHSVQKNDSIKKSLIFGNVGSSPLVVVISDATDHSVSRVTGASERPFLIHPRIFTVQPNTRQTVNVVFAPTDDGFHSQRLCIVASGENREVALDGRCVKGVVYALVPHTSLGGSRVIAISFTDDIGCQPASPVFLAFEEAELKTILIGGVMNGPSGEWEVLNWEQTHPLTVHPEWSVTPLSQPFGADKESCLCIQHVASDDRGSCKSSTLFPFHFTVVLKGEAAGMSTRRALYIVCTSR